MTWGPALCALLGPTRRPSASVPSAPRCPHRVPAGQPAPPPGNVCVSARPPSFAPCPASPRLLCPSLSLAAGVGARRRLGSSDPASVFQAAKLAKMKVPPGEMFLSESDKYSKFDENVRIPFFPPEHCQTTERVTGSSAWARRLSVPGTVCRRSGSGGTCLRSRGAWSCPPSPWPRGSGAGRRGLGCLVCF